MIKNLEILANRAKDSVESRTRANYSIPCRQMPAKPGTRLISVGIDNGSCADIAISEADAWAFIADGLLYECEDGLHDLHIDVCKPWTGEDVARVLAAADKLARAGAAQ